MTLMTTARDDLFNTFQPLCMIAIVVVLSGIE